MLGAGGAAKKTYMDDVFSTFLYKGNDSARSINNGIDLSGKGGMTWLKERDGTFSHRIFDTERGAPKSIYPNLTTAEGSDATELTSFNNNGFSLGTQGAINDGDNTYSSWSFRKAKGFFDVVTWTGDGNTPRTISHSLSCIPGMIIVKNRDSTEDWAVYHRSIGATKYLRLNLYNVASTSATLWADTEPTSSNFTVGNSARVNGNGDTYVAYVFAGGESTAATARSVDFDGSGDYLTTNSSSDYTPGTGDFTLEYWYKPSENAVDFLVDASAGSEVWSTYCNASGIHKYYVGGVDRIVSRSSLVPDKWHHIAVVRISGTVTMYINGIAEGGTYNDTNNYTFNALHIGRRSSYNDLEYNGKISNLRYVVGTGVYTSAFKPPTEPLTNITNTKLLCCNSSSVTGATVGTINSNGDPTASTDSPFDDPAAFKFGENGDQNIITCGSYEGTGSAGFEINLGFEPQWLLIKNTNEEVDWQLIDSMRGAATDGNDAISVPNKSDSDGSSEVVDITSTGFIVSGTGQPTNTDGKLYVYMAIRRPDGYVGKPAEAGTDVFDMDAGNGSSTAPAFDSGFPVDMRIGKGVASTEEWYLGTRFMYQKHVRTNNTGGDMAGSWSKFDYSAGEGASWSSGYQGWMWKRHAGFDVVCYKGNGNNTNGANAHAHNLGKAPEMIWIKTRSGGTYSGSTHWTMSHKSLNGGTNPWQYTMSINNTWAEATTSNFGNTAPTSTHFYVGDPGNGRSNDNNSNYVAMLFASVPGISAVGSYDGHSSNNINLTSQLDFTPRFFMCKSTTDTTGWLMVDKTRDTNMGKRLFFNTATAETSYDAVWAMSKHLEPNKTGLSVDGEKYIFYAHA